jgi:hypothetical protein
MICKVIILSIILYGCGTWYLNFRDEYALQVLEEAGIRKRLDTRIPNRRRISLFIKATNIFRTVKFERQELEWYVVRLWKRRNVYII